jgi:hypothetical protein
MLDVIMQSMAADTLMFYGEFFKFFSLVHMYNLVEEIYIELKFPNIVPLSPKGVYK